MKEHSKHRFIGLSAFFPEQKILAISDLHIGLEEAFAAQGQLLPKSEFKESEKRLVKILQETKPDKVVLCGDIKHEFGTISDTEWRDTLRIIDLITKHAKMILVRGNHDTILGPIADKRNIEIVDYYVENDILFLHGDKLPNEINQEKDKTRTLSKKTASTARNREGGANKVSDGGGGGMIASRTAKQFATSLDLKKISTIMIGHEHPAIILEHAERKEKYKCFLVGKFQGKELLVLPSFNTINEGTNVLEENLLSPFLKDIRDFEVFIVGDEVYDFGKVKEIKKKF